MTTTLYDLIHSYNDGRKVSYYNDLVEDLTIEQAFEEDEQKSGQIKDRIGNLQRRVHSIPKPKSLLEKASYGVGRFVGN